MLGRQKRAVGKLPTAPNGIEIVQRNQLPGPLKNADRPTRHRNRTNWHQRFLLATLGRHCALCLRGACGRLAMRRRSAAFGRGFVGVAALLQQH